jgi:hypothetical protein
MSTLHFSGHETFYCRHFWLKKGYDFISTNMLFSQKDAVLELGVGRNMVGAINFWTKAFGIQDEANHTTTELGQKLFGENGLDPFLEDEGSLWLLQYFLVKNERASIYKLALIDFRQSRLTQNFTRSQLLEYIQKEGGKRGEQLNTRTLENDVKVFIRNYVLPRANTGSIEENFSALLLDLNLITDLDTTSEDGDHLYRFNVNQRENIRTPIFLFMLLDFMGESTSMDIDSIVKNVGDFVLCDREGLEAHLNSIVTDYKGITYKQDAGRKELQVKKGIDKWQILAEYYA